MDHLEVGRYWDGNADAWTELSRAGYDVCRDYVNTPGFMATLPDVSGLQGLDIGCGEGHNTRLVARRGARLTGLDISPRFVSHARAKELEEPLGIRYLNASAQEMPLPDACFDFATSFMCLMDIPAPELAVAETYRILKPGGFLQFAITHPCFDTPHRRKLRDENGVIYAYELGGYFQHPDGDVFEWLFSAAPEEERSKWPRFRTPIYRRTLSWWLNTLATTGFVVEACCEPTPDEAVLIERPDLDDMAVIAFALILRCRKAG
jgi:SAM-dependent methyltransferase